MKTDVMLAVGILSVGQAAEVLGVSPLAVKRLIALGVLNDNRNQAGSVVFKSDLEQYIGSGSPRLGDMPPITTDQSGFLNVDGELPFMSFIQTMKGLSDGLAVVSQEQAERAYQANKTARSYSFEVRATPAMREQFIAPMPQRLSVVRQQFRQAYGREVLSLPYGIMAMVTELRSAAMAAARELRPGETTVLQSPLHRLYSTPQAFARFVDRARAATENRLSIEFRDTFTTSDGTQKTIIREVPLSSMTSSLESDFRRAIAAAF